MSRINTNVSSIIAQAALGRSNRAQQTALDRLSSGLRINRGKDDPAGLIASENLRRDITSANKAITNSERAAQLIATADSALGQVSNILNDIRGLIVESANDGALSPEQIEANQLQIDSSIDAINRVAQITNFQGQSILDGRLDFDITAGTGFGTVTDYSIQQATIGSSATSVDVQIANAATQAQIDAGTAAFDGSSNLNDDVTFALAGSEGATSFTFASGTNIDDIVSAINLQSDAIGVSATNNAGVLELVSDKYGSKGFVEVDVISEGGSGTFEANLTDALVEGADIDATVNGVQASGDGNTLSIDTATLDLELTVEDGSSTAIAFDIDGGGAVFQLGPDVVSNQQARFGIGSLNAAYLGGASGKLFELAKGQSYSLETDTAGAVKIVDEVISKVAELRGRLGAFERTTLDTNIETLNDLVVNLTAAESSIRDADFAKESAALTRAQILVQSGTAVLQIANQNPQNALALLG